MASAVQRPGIDPRTWISLAVVTELGFDAEEGPFADVRLLPTGEVETCLVGTLYAGGGFGLWAPLKVDDTVLVALPNGDPGAGPIVVCRMWDKADPPFAEMKAAEEQDGHAVPTAGVVLRVEAGQTLRILAGDTVVTVSGSDVTITPGGSGKVKLGGADGLQAAALGDTLKTHLDALKLAFDTHTHVESGGTTAVPVPLSPTVPDVTSSNVEVKT